MCDARPKGSSEHTLGLAVCLDRGREIGEIALATGRQQAAWPDESETATERNMVVAALRRLLR